MNERRMEYTILHRHGSWRRRTSGPNNPEDGGKVGGGGVEVERKATKGKESDITRVHTPKGVRGTKQARRVSQEAWRLRLESEDEQESCTQQRAY